MGEIVIGSGSSPRTLSPASDVLSRVRCVDATEEAEDLLAAQLSSHVVVGLTAVVLELALLMLS